MEVGNGKKVQVSTINIFYYCHFLFKYSFAIELQTLKKNVSKCYQHF